MRRRVLRAAVLAAGALLVAGATARGRGRAWDDRLYERINSGLAHPALDRLFAGVTELGSLWASLGAGAAVTLAGRRREAATAVGAAATTWALGQGLKRLYGRLRPYDSGSPGRLLIARPRGTSWPSSHPAVFATFASVAARELSLSRSSRAALAATAAAVACSRIYLGVHYPSDVVGGLLLGRAVGTVWPSPVPRSFG